MQLHVAQGGKAVKSGIGHSFQGLVKAVFLQAGNELLALAIDFGGPGLAANQGDAALRLAESNLELAVVVRQAQQVGSSRDGGDKVFAGLRGLGLEFGLVHGFYR